MSIFKKERIKNEKAMLSQPMAGKTDEEIVSTREKLYVYKRS